MIWELFGSNMMAFVGTSGSPPPEGPGSLLVQVVPLFAVTYTWGVPKPPTATHTLSSLVGEMAKSMIYRSGRLLGEVPIILVNGVFPVVVISTLAEGV